MKYTPGILREVLHSLIRKLGETPEQFVRQPGRDFTRPRTLVSRETFELVQKIKKTHMRLEVSPSSIEFC